jgi:ribosomal protein S18 acetylase RimI-like enzyme
VILSCRPAAEGDISQIAALQSAAYPDNEHKPIGPQLPNLYVGVADAGVVGYGRLRRHHAPRFDPPGYYLGGVVVDPAWRRHGIGTKLTECRVEAAWAAGAEMLYYFANSRNEASIAMHRDFGFTELQRPYEFPGVTFADGVGVLFGLTRDAVRSAWPARESAQPERS